MKTDQLFTHKFYFISLICISMIISIYGCVPQPKLVEKSKETKPQNITTNLNQVCSEICAVIATKLWKYKKNETVELHVTEGPGQYRDHVLLNQFISEKTQHKLGQFSQLKVVSHTDPQKECTIYIDLLKKEDKIGLLLKIVDKQNSIFFSKTYMLEPVDIIGAEYQKFKTEMRRGRQQATLRITAISKGLTEIVNKGNSSGFSYPSLSNAPFYQRKSNRTDSQDGYYPLEHSCRINGKSFKLDHGTFFDGKVDPGVYTIDISFKGGMWDSRNKQQNIVTGLMSARKTITIRNNEIRNIELFFLYDGQVGAIEINPFGDFSHFDRKGKVIKVGNKKDSVPEKKLVKRYSFSKRDLEKIERLMSKYSKRRIIKLILSNTRNVTISQNGVFKTFSGSPNHDLVNNKTVFIDFQRMGINTIEAEQSIITQIAREKRKRKKREEEARRRAEEARKFRAYEFKTQLTPRNHVRKIVTYLRGILKDPQSLQIDGVTEPQRIVLSGSALGLTAGQILWVSQVCYNAKNSYGGYVGIRCYKFYFRDGRIIHYK